VPVASGLARRAGAGGANRFDREPPAFHERVRAGFLALAAEDPGAWCVIDASRSLEDVIADAWEAVHAAVISR
jgi:dTMP kinase